MKWNDQDMGKTFATLPAGAVEVESHGKAFAKWRVPHGHWEIAYRKPEGWYCSGAGLDEQCADEMIEEQASGVAAERMAAFHAWLNMRVAECDKTAREMMEGAGYQTQHTGGGCMAWEKKLDDGYIWICTGDNDITGDPNKADWLIGRYSELGESWVNIDMGFTLADALKHAAELPYPELGGQQYVQECYPTMDDMRRDIARREAAYRG